MANLNFFLKFFPNQLHTTLLRGVAITFSTISLALFATTLSIYNNQIAPIDGLAPLNDALLTVNAVPIVPLTLSIIWCITLFLAFCFQAHTQNATDCSADGTTIPESQFKKPLVSPKLEAAIDSVLWVFMVVTLGFAAAEVANWRRGDMQGFVGVGMVRLSGCPSVNPTTRTLEWYCTTAWRRLSGLQIAACCHLGLAR
jgi:hypothetical protein